MWRDGIRRVPIGLWEIGNGCAPLVEDAEVTMYWISVANRVTTVQYEDTVFQYSIQWSDQCCTEVKSTVFVQWIQ